MLCYIGDMVRFRIRLGRTPRVEFIEPLIPPQLKRRRRKGGKDDEEGGVPVEPNKPNTLSGGAAAELEFDD